MGLFELYSALLYSALLYSALHDLNQYFKLCSSTTRDGADLIRALLGVKSVSSLSSMRFLFLLVLRAKPSIIDHDVQKCEIKSSRTARVARVKLCRVRWSIIMREFRCDLEGNALQGRGGREETLKGRREERLAARSPRWQFI